MHLIEKATKFSQSKLWQLQQDYFNSAEIEAWTSGQVPHYITSNPKMGQTYAELVLALLRDLSVKGKSNDPVYLIDLGAGPGRLCYHFFKHFERYYTQSAIALPPFCYILSDFTPTSEGFWLQHPRLQSYLEKGWLDVAQFNATTDTTINLGHSGKTIEVQSLAQPLVVIANYFFDSIPQELFRIKNGRIKQALLSLSSELSAETEDPGQLIQSLQLEYSYEAASPPVYPDEPILNQLLQFYQEQLGDAHLLFPQVGIRCLERLRALSNMGLVLLTADKGDHHFTNLDGSPEPHVATHGSFSLPVNYHALKLYCENEKGLTLFPRHEPGHLDLGCLLFLNEASSYLETINTYDKVVQDYGPDDFFSLKKLVEKRFGSLSYEDIMAVTRLSGYDARIFQQMLPDLKGQIESMSSNERWSLLLMVPRIWDTYFPLVEADNLASNLGNLLMELHFFEEALLYYQKSFDIYGRTEDVLYHTALCHCMLENKEAAKPFVAELLEHHPMSESLQLLFTTFQLAGLPDKK